MTMSPTYGDPGCPLPGAAAGNDSTLVGAFLPRQSRLSARIAESSLSTIASSLGGVETAWAAAKMAVLTMVLALGRLRHRAERMITSISGGFFVLLRLGVGDLLNPLARLWPHAGVRRRPCRMRRRSSPPARGGPHPRRRRRRSRCPRLRRAAASLRRGRTPDPAAGRPGSDRR